MTKSLPIISGNTPKAAVLTKGEEYYFCTCGRSANQPFCDGSHASTSFKPLAFTAEEDGTAYLCACKHTANAPFCDGSHKQFSDDDVGTEGPQETAHKPAEESTTTSLPLADPTPEEPTVVFIHQLAKEGLSKLGHHGPMTSMGVPRHLLPHWDDIQIMPAQLACRAFASRGWRARKRSVSRTRPVEQQAGLFQAAQTLPSLDIVAACHSINSCHSDVWRLPFPWL